MFEVLHSATCHFLMQAEHWRLILLGGIFAPGRPLLVGAIVDSKWCACAGFSQIY
jgi:hypothetical protein